MMFEKDYRRLMTVIGGVALLQSFLFTFLYGIIELVKVIILDRADNLAHHVIGEILSSTAYFLAFIIPACLFYVISPKKGRAAPYFEVRLTGEFPLMLLASLALISASAYVNSLLVELMGRPGIGFEQSYDTNIDLVLAILSTAIIPAFCEELLYRGVILTNILPYGKTPAIISSAVLFSLMHANAAQTLYAFVAGILLGLVYVKTRSIWGCILIHFFNNLISVIQVLIDSRLDSNISYFINLCIELSVFVLGSVSAIILLYRASKKNRVFDKSGYGVIFEPYEDYVERQLPRKFVVKYFFSPTIITFIVIIAIFIFLIRAV